MLQTAAEERRGSSRGRSERSTILCHEYTYAYTYMHSTIQKYGKFQTDADFDFSVTSDGALSLCSNI